MKNSYYCLATVSPLALLCAMAAAPAKATTYTVVDLGAPAAYELGSPVSLNNTGQIVGQATANGVVFPAGYSYQTCIAYNAGWIPFDGVYSLPCTPAGAGISDANASGVFASAGSKQVATEADPIAYYAKISRAGVTTLVYLRNAPSRFAGMNSLGYAVAETYFAQPGGWFGREAPVYSAGGSQLALLQPLCTLSGPGCMLFPGQSPYPDPGYYLLNGRIVATDGSTFGTAADSTPGQYVVVAKSGKALFQFSLPTYPNVTPTVAGMDDAHRIVYGVRPFLYEYDPTTRHVTTLGKLPGPCTFVYTAIAVNGPGDVLGSATSQSTSCSSTRYFLWKRASGMQPIDFASPSPTSLTAMNDLDQIVGVTMPKTVNDWVLLKPSAGSNRRAWTRTSAPTLEVPVTIVDADVRSEFARDNEPTGPRATAFQVRGVSPSSRAGALVRFSQTSRPPSAKPVEFAIVDVGAPPVGGGYPIALNNTGQIVGTGVAEAFTCETWTGKRWLQFGAAPCEPTTGITDADAGGTFRTVGSESSPTNQNPTAFEATIGANATVTTFPANAPSWLFAMNSAGEAVGTTWYDPFGGWFQWIYGDDDRGEISPVTSNGTTFSILQPSCTDGLTGCMASPLFAGGNAEIYHAGAVRALASDGTILGIASDARFGRYVEITKTTVRQFSLPLPSGAENTDYVVGIDDTRSVVYQQVNASGSFVSRYNAATGVASAIPTVPGSTCINFVPISVNASGEILGSANTCLNGSDAAAWTWNPRTGKTALITYATHGYSRVTVYWVNDEGDLLADLKTTSGAVHWGYLKPLSAAPAAAR